jgi:Zn-dependent M28 family amino/carboxypeptidase
MKYSIALTVVLVCVGAAPGDDADPSGERIRAHVKFLSSDLLEGRGVGARGGDLAAEYIASQFAVAGAMPAGDRGTYFQKVPLVGVRTAPGAELSVLAGDQTLALRWGDDFIGTSQSQKSDMRIDAEAIFAGHGIVAPEYHWNDYKDAEVRGKIVVLFTNEPASDDPKFFGGRALTYYGRWTYKYEQALRMGALGCILIHTTPTAGYGWDVVRSSWSGEQPFVKLAPGQTDLALAGWVTQDAGERILALAGHSVQELLHASESRDFRPIRLGLHVRAHFASAIRELDTRNVAAVVSGSDPRLQSETVIFTAHWDHLGVGEPVNGDAIYNGAIDNATGCGILLELAHAWAALPQKPRRSALFLALTGEEGGLRGSEYYAAHPIFPPGKTVVDVNFDALMPYGRTQDVVVAGAERTTLWPLVEQIARRMELTIDPDPRPEQGSYYRSDHFSLAHAGIPAFSVEQGTQFYGKPADYGARLFEEYNDKHYHQPSDEYHPDWDFAGLEQMARFGFLIAIEAANQESLPTWRAGDEFQRAREASGVHQTAP